MKAVLVIEEMPNDCVSGCPVMCRTRGINHRPTWCPLRPLPEKMSWGHTADYIYGFNDCIDELTQEPYGGYKTTGIESIEPIK